MNTKFKPSKTIIDVNEDNKLIYDNNNETVAMIFYDEKDPNKSQYLSAIFSHAHEMQKILKMLVNDYDIDIGDVQVAAYKVLFSIKNQYSLFEININKEKELKYLNRFGIKKDG